MKTSMLRLLLPALALVTLFQVDPALAGDSAFDRELHSIQQAWAVASYETPAGDARTAALEALGERAAALVEANPGRAEALVWQGIVLSSHAGAKGGLGALGLARKARDSLEAAIAIDPSVLDGSAYTSLGTLYHKVPGFPLGFGNDVKARDLFSSALAINPSGIDANFFFGEYLLDKGEYEEAARHFERALAAKPRPGRELADRGRRQEASAMLAKARSKSSG